jgi:peptidoglycan hydrolase-like protein with peptidoglycan-binding domain
VAEDTEAIRHAQQQLQAAGFTPGPATGILDDRTREALREFQRSKGLQETGQLDQETRSALVSSSGTPRPSEKSQ